MLKAEIAGNIDDTVVKNTVLISGDSYPPGWFCGNCEECYSEVLRKPRNILVLLGDNGKNVGFLLAVPHNDAVAELEDDDPLMKEDSGAYYIQNGAILPAYRRKGALSKMFAVLREELRKRNIYRLTMHARVSNMLSRGTQENMKILEVRRIDAWKYYAYEEPTDYIVAEWPAEEGPV